MRLIQRATVTIGLVAALAVASLASVGGFASGLSQGQDEQAIGTGPEGALEDYVSGPEGALEDYSGPQGALEDYIVAPGAGE